MNVIPNSLLPESLVTDTSAGLSTGVDAACGGNMVLNGAGLPELSGAAIPANGSCEVSFLVRTDIRFSAYSDGFNFTYSLGQGLLGSAQGASNAAVSSVQQRQYGHYTGSELNPASGYTGEAFTLLLKVVNAGSTTPMDTSSGTTGAVVPGLVWKIGEGVEPELAKFPPAGFVPAAGCPALRATDWDSVARTLTVRGRLPNTNCMYKLPFRSVYAGPDDAKDIAITPLAPHRFATAGGGLTSSGPMNMTTMDPRFRAVNGVSTADAVTIDARLLNSDGAVTNNIPRGGLAMLELELKAPQGVSDFNLQGTGQLRNASTAFSYLPAPTSSCGGTIVAPVGSPSFRLTGANIAAGGTCTVRLMVASRDWGVNFAVRAGDAYGIVAGNRVFSPGYSWDPIHFSGEYFAVSHQFSPAVVGRNAPQTVYTWSLKKPAGRPPVEALTADVNLARASGLDLGLKAFEVVSDTVAEGGLQVRIGGAGGNETQNLAAAEATLQVFAAAKVTISKRVSGEAAGAPETGLYGVNLTCAKSGSIPLKVSVAAPAVQEIVAGDDCTVSEDSNKPVAKAGYHWERESITPAADFVTVAGGANAVTIDNPLALNALVSISTALNATTASLSPADLGGTAPDLMLLCTPVATGAAPAWQAPEAAQCQLSTAGGEAPADHALGAVAYGGSGVHAQTGAFVAPASGINDLAAVVTLTRTPVTGVPQAIPALHPAMLLVLSGELGGLAGRARRRGRATST